VTTFDPKDRGPPRCTTHHHACDCREWEHAREVKRLADENAKLRDDNARMHESCRTLSAEAREQWAKNWKRLADVEDELRLARDENVALRLDLSSGGGRQSSAGRLLRDLRAERELLVRVSACAERHLEASGNLATTANAGECWRDLYDALTALDEHRSKTK
jgi:hypothetical protein